MTQEEYSDTLSRNSSPRRHGTSPQQNYSSIAGVQHYENEGPGAQRSDNSAHAGEVPNEENVSVLIGIRILGSGFILAHLISLLMYSIFGLSSSEKDNYLSIFVYGGSIISFSSYVVLYYADINKLTSSRFEREQGENWGTYWAKAGLMGIILPLFNFIGLIILFKKGRQDHTTFGLGIVSFISYLLGNTLLLFKKEENTESEQHELQENNPPVGNSTTDNALVDNSPATNSAAASSAAANSAAANSAAANSAAAISAAANSPVDNSTVDNSLVDNSSGDNSLRPSIRTFP